MAIRFAVALLCVLSVPASAQPVAAPMRVLFVGNSLTYINDLPGMVATLAKAAGRPIHVESITFPDFGLEQHWQKGDARRIVVTPLATNSFRTRS